MSNSPSNEGVSIEPVVSFRNLALKYGKTLGLDHVTLDIPARKLIGMIGPDGVGKSTLLSLVTGAHAMQDGDLRVLGGDMRDRDHRNKVCPKIAYMPQGLGKNLYFTLTVEENLQFFARLFGHNAAERRRRIDRLTKSTGLYPFLNRPAGKLSGGMKQKLGLCCSLIHDPDLLVLDEPTTGVDPLARRQFWDLVDSIREAQENMSVIVATAYMDEAQRFDWLIAMNDGKILDTGTPAEILTKTGKDNLDDAFIELLPEEQRADHKTLVVPPLETTEADGYSIEAEGLTKRFGTFTAVDHVSFALNVGECLGIIGESGSGKSTVANVVTRLLDPTEGEIILDGENITKAGKKELRAAYRKMQMIFQAPTESFDPRRTLGDGIGESLRNNGRSREETRKEVERLLELCGLTPDFAGRYPYEVSGGQCQRAAIARALAIEPGLLICDEATSALDVTIQKEILELLNSLRRQKGSKLSILFISHDIALVQQFCDRLLVMYKGKIVEQGTPDEIIKNPRDEYTKRLIDSIL